MQSEGARTHWRNLWPVALAAAMSVGPAVESRSAEKATVRENQPMVSEPTAATSGATAVSTAQPAPSPAKRRAPEDTVKAQLDGTRWAIDLTPLSASEKVKPQKDIVTFAGGKVSSERFSKAGYPETNLTLTIGGDGVPVWETMQTKEGEGVVFWRGELHGSTMRGVVSKHPVEGSAEDFSFSGREASGKAVAVGDQPSAEPASAVPSASSTQEAPLKKKRKGLFGR